MAKHPNCNRLLRATRADIKKRQLWTGRILKWMKIVPIYTCVWLIADSMAAWMIDWAVAVAVIDVFTYYLFILSILCVMLQNLHEKTKSNWVSKKRKWKRWKSIHGNKIYIRHTFNCRCEKRSDTHRERTTTETVFVFFFRLLFFYCLSNYMEYWCG